MTVGSIYDPNGYIAPVTLKGKQILQQMCKDKLDWDSPIPEYIRPQWEKWRQEITELEKLEIPQCFKPKHFGPHESSGNALLLQMLQWMVMVNALILTNMAKLTVLSLLEKHM